MAHTGDAALVSGVKRRHDEATGEVTSEVTGDGKRARTDEGTEEVVMLKEEALTFVDGVPNVATVKVWSTASSRFYSMLASDALTGTLVLAAPDHIVRLDPQTGAMAHLVTVGPLHAPGAVVQLATDPHFVCPTSLAVAADGTVFVGDFGGVVAIRPGEGPAVETHTYATAGLPHERCMVDKVAIKPAVTSHVVDGVIVDGKTVIITHNGGVTRMQGRTIVENFSLFNGKSTITDGIWASHFHKPSVVSPVSPVVGTDGRIFFIDTTAVRVLDSEGVWTLVDAKKPDGSTRPILCRGGTVTRPVALAYYSEHDLLFVADSAGAIFQINLNTYHIHKLVGERPRCMVYWPVDGPSEVAYIRPGALAIVRHMLYFLDGTSKTGCTLRVVSLSHLGLAKRWDAVVAWVELRRQWAAQLAAQAGLSDDDEL